MRRKKVMLLAGCGLSKAASKSIPCLPSLIKKYCEKIGRNDLCTEIDKNKAIINDILGNLSKDGEMNKKEWRDTIEEFAIEVQNANPTDPAHTSILNLWEKRYLNWIFCLNYDDLIERSFGRDKYEIIRTPSDLKRFLQTLSNKLPLIKAHGDLWMMQCPECGRYKTVPTNTPHELYREERCEYCNDGILEPYAAMPDSARTASTKFVERLGNKIKEFDLIICVGFSGEYDTHITGMLEESQKLGTKICKIDPIETRLSYISDIKIDLYAEDAFTKIQETLEGIEAGKKDKENMKGLNLAFSHTLLDSIYQAIPLTEIEWEICKNPRFRGLQWIYQLGLKYCKFIGARHSRFEHSLGTMQVADEIYMHLQEDTDKRNADERQFLRLGALLHDIGHVCFGHLGEETIKELGIKNFSHAAFADEVLMDSGLKNILEDFFKDSYYTYEDIIKLINGNSGILILDKVIDSPYDADKLEYLLRDSKMTGKEYGLELDKSTFLNNIVIRSNDLFIKEEGTSALERIAEARYHMYKEVYANADVRGYESMFKKVLKAWIRDNPSKEFKLESREWLRNFLKSDDVIMAGIKEDLDDAWKKRKTNKATFWKGGADKLKFVKKVLDIVGGAEELPKPLLINIKAKNGSEPQYIKKVLQSLSSIEDEFRYDVIIDTYFFDPLGGYKNEPFIIREDNKLYKLSDLSPLVNAIKNAYDYKIRVYLIDEDKRERIVDRIEEELKNTKIITME